MPSILLHDPIYTYVEVPPHLVELINTPEFQRLRQVKQLATVFFRYPGAHHTRFEHCVGTFHLARTMLNFLRFDIKERFITNSEHIKPPKIPLSSQMEVEMAALLHDIGHGPFGHTMDFLLDRVGWDPNKRHEYFGIKKITDENSEINKKLMASTNILNLDIQNICGFIDGNPPVTIGGRQLTGSEPFYYAFLGHIISSAVNADRMDYLMRDAHHTGVRMVAIDLTGIFDALRLFGYFTSLGEKDTEIDLAFDLEGLWAIEGMLLSHIAMYKTVYHNFTHRILQEMLVRAFESYLEKKYGNLTSISEEDVYKLMKLTDHEAMTLLQEQEESGEILKRIFERHPYHRVLEIPWSRMSPLVKKIIRKFQGAKEAIPELEKLVSDECPNISPREIIIDLPTLKYLSVDIHLLEKLSEGKHRVTNLNVESDVAVMLGRVPFVDKMTIAIAKKVDIPSARKMVKKLFHF